MSDKIIVKSNFGFKIASAPNDWVRCDTSFIDSDAFKSLKVGSIVDKVIVNKKGFVIKVILMETNGANANPSAKFSHIPNTDSTSFNSDSTRKGSFDSRNDSILKGQCLNLVFNGMFSNGVNIYEIEQDLNRERAIKLTRKLYEELKEANFEDW